MTPLSRVMLRRVLSTCSASVRKSLQGLDYFISDGGKAFDDLLKLVDKLIDCGIQSIMLRIFKECSSQGRAISKVTIKKVFFSEFKDIVCF